jgi:hypothetical protein
MIAAQLGLAGIDPMLFLRSKDQDEVTILQVVAAAATQIREREAHNLAVLIANKVGELFG